MSKVEEIEQAARQLPINEFVELALWVDRRRQELELSLPADSGRSVRNHSAFLSGYAPEDENLYDDAKAR